MSEHYEARQVLRKQASSTRQRARDLAGGMNPDTWRSQPVAGLVDRAIMFEAAASLLETHDDTGISLDNYLGPRELVNRALTLVGLPPFTRNGV